MTSAEFLTSLSEKAKAAFRGSPAKTSSLMGLGVIMVIAWIRVLVGGHTNPSTAHAGTVEVASNVSPISTALPVPGDAAPQISTLQQWARQPSPPLTRNPFAVPLDFYPSDGAKDGEDASTGTGYWDLLRKSMSSRADQQEQRQILVDNIRIAAEALNLDSTIMGRTPGAMVNGQMVREGSVVSGFQVLKIEARRVIVEREGVKLAVMMN